MPVDRRQRQRAALAAGACVLLSLAVVSPALLTGRRQELYTSSEEDSDDDENEEKLAVRRSRKPVWYDTTFSTLEARVFFRYFRVTKTTFHRILDAVSVLIRRRRFPLTSSKLKRLLACFLRHLATG